MPQLPQGFTAPPPPGGTRLITRSNEETPFTITQETDARTALTRGLAEYLSQLQYDDVGGRRLMFERVFDTWADPEDEGAYPAAAVYSDGPGEYEASQLMSTVSSEQRVGPAEAVDSVFVVSPSTYGVDLLVDVRCNDTEARSSLCAMLERDLNPVDWRYGFLLLLPHYFNQRGVYELVGSGYEDSESEALDRLRRATFRLRATVPATVLRKYPNAKIRAAVNAT